MPPHMKSLRFVPHITNVIIQSFVTSTYRVGPYFSQEQNTLGRMRNIYLLDTAHAGATNIPLRVSNFM
jgi:hypothetical protein